ncbi:uncharacterized protein LOC120698580 isoform X2 [Panicum virgatum]|uniref:uncharacterized protein LOC120698580 isoform X2 n=1 Tax=Panicum virgatum TaxID=38727 RepID=UPI0019D61970|nr:uncharacterized protein LOC120698580 isoform X2 [Panicum virgatum]
MRTHKMFQGLRAHPIHSQRSMTKSNVSGKETARYAAMSQEEKNARNLRLREARQKKKEFLNPMKTNSSRAPLGDLTNQTNGGAESAPDSQSQEEKNARIQRVCEARRKKKEYQNLMETNCSRAPFGDLTNHTNGGAESAHNSPSVNSDNKHRKRQRERARYAAKSQEEKNAGNLRLREACKKKERC